MATLTRRRTQTFQPAITLAIETCCTCGCVFGVEESFHRREILERAQQFYCPNGHCMSYKKTETDRLREALATAEHDKEWYRLRARDQEEKAERARRSNSALRGVVTRTKNKIAKGICPCCDQYFPDLHGHMTDAHPDFEQTEEVPVDAEEAATE